MSAVTTTGSALVSDAHDGTGVGKRDNTTARIMNMFSATTSTQMGKEEGNASKTIQITNGLISADHFRGHTNVSTGLAYNIQGRATRIEADVGDSLATFQDPIKALFGTRICGGQVVQVSRKYVVGGKATAVPERAPARVVRVQEDVREVKLRRYGADLEMNLNLFMKPDEAQKELDLKLNAQKQALENELICQGYAAIMRDGLRLSDAIARSLPRSQANGDLRQAGDGRGGGGVSNPFNSTSLSTASSIIFKESVFGAFQRFEYPLQNLIAAAKNCTAYRNVVGSGSMMILPHASPELISWTKPCHMEYAISGISNASKEALTVELDEVYKEPMVGMKIMVHHPPANFSAGSSQPVRGQSPLSRKLTLFFQAGGYVTDFANPGEVKNVPDVAKLVLWTSSAIIGKPGEETGELLVGYPFTSVSTNQRTESMSVQLRVYLGAILKQPENVIVINDCCFEGVEYFGSTETGDTLPTGSLQNLSTFDGSSKQLTRRHHNILGELDDPQKCVAMHGVQVFKKR